VNLKEFVHFLNKVVEGIVELILTRPSIVVSGKKIKKALPGENGLLFIDNFRIELSNYMPIKDDENYLVIVKNYEIEIIDKNGDVVQRIKGQYISDDKT